MARPYCETDWRDAARSPRVVLMALHDEMRDDMRRGSQRRFRDGYMDDPFAAGWTYFYWIIGILVLGGLASLVGAI